MKKTFWGLVLIVLGVLALLQGTGQFYFGLTLWPVVLLLVSLNIAWHSLSHNGRGPSWFGLVFGLWLGAMGLADILANLGIGTFTSGMIAHMGWAILLIGVGLSMLFGRRSWINFRWDGDGRRRWDGHGRRRWDGRFVGDARYGQGAPWRLDHDLHVNHGVGDVKLDLTTAEISEGTHHLTVDAAIGEILVRVPDNVDAYVNASASIGDLSVFGDHRSGLGLSLQKDVVVPDAKVTLNIEAKLGIGSIRIVQSPAQTRLTL